MGALLVLFLVALVFWYLTQREGNVLNTIATADALYAADVYLVTADGLVSGLVAHATTSTLVSH